MRKEAAVSRDCLKIALSIIYSEPCSCWILFSSKPDLNAPSKEKANAISGWNNQISHTGHLHQASTEEHRSGDGMSSAFAIWLQKTRQAWGWLTFPLQRRRDAPSPRHSHNMTSQQGKFTQSFLHSVLNWKHKPKGLLFAKSYSTCWGNMKT